MLRMVPVPNPSPAMVAPFSSYRNSVECLAAVVHGVVDDRDRDGLAGLAGLERQRSGFVFVVHPGCCRSGEERDVRDGYGPAPFPVQRDDEVRRHAGTLGRRRVADRDQHLGVGVALDLDLHRGDRVGVVAVGRPLRLDQAFVADRPAGRSGFFVRSGVIHIHQRFALSCPEKHPVLRVCVQVHRGLIRKTAAAVRRLRIAPGLPHLVLVHPEDGTFEGGPVLRQGCDLVPVVGASVSVVPIQVHVHRLVLAAPPCPEVEGDRFELVPAGVRTRRERLSEVDVTQHVTTDTQVTKVGHQDLCRRRSGPGDQRDDHGDGRDQPCGPFCPLGGRRPQLPNPSAPAVRCVSLAARAPELGRSCSHPAPPSYVWLLPPGSSRPMASPCRPLSVSPRSS